MDIKMLALITVLLVVIILLLAPWIIGVVLFFAAYIAATIGPFAVFLAAIIAITAIAYTAVFATKELRRSKKEQIERDRVEEIAGERSPCKRCQIEIPALEVLCSRCKAN